MTSNLLNLKQQQALFTAYVRDPLHNPAPQNVKPERMEMYAQLLFNNVDSFISSNFPVLKKILSPLSWTALLRDFYCQHQSQTPYFSELAQEFLSYLQDERNNPDDLPFILELAHYEWVEMALSIEPQDVVVFKQNEPSSLADTLLAVSPLAWPLAYRYPVHQLSPDYTPLEPPAEVTFLCVYRDTADDVKFMQITPMTYQLLDYLQTNNAMTGRACVTALIGQNNTANSESLITAGLEILQTLAEKGIVIPGELRLTE